LTSIGSDRRGADATPVAGRRPQARSVRQSRRQAMQNCRRWHFLPSSLARMSRFRSAARVVPLFTDVAGFAWQLARFPDENDGFVLHLWGRVREASLLPLTGGIAMVEQMGQTEERFYTPWLVVRRAEDVPGQWVAHCLDFDLVTQGNSMLQAMEMACDAVEIVLADDVAHNLDPYSRRAPQKVWTEFYDRFSRALPIKGDVGQLREEDVGILIGQATFRVCLERADHAPKKIEHRMPIVLETTRDCQA
jgi:predicted RNase H-like HicB family nuclease